MSSRSSIRRSIRRFNFLHCVLLAPALAVAGCATDVNDSFNTGGDATSDGGSNSSNGGGGTDAAGGETGEGGDGAGGTTSHGGEGGEGGEGGTPVVGCPQDCTTIEVPECFVAMCNESTHVCDILAAEDGAACEDGEFCTVDDTCYGGTCEAGTPRECAAGVNGCVISTCDEDLDACSDTPVANGSPCTSTDVCLTNTICINGQCDGAPKDCSATPLTAPECQTGACDPANGQCVVIPINDGTPCTIGDICESSKMCDQGECIGTPIPDCTGCTESEPNNTYAAANTGVGCASWAGAIGVVADKDCFAVTVTDPGTRLDAEIVDVGGTGCPSGFDPYMRLYNSSGTEIATDDDTGTGLCSKLSVTGLAAGTYSVCVEELGNNATSPPYLVLIGLVAPGCNNGVVEYGEDCDGGPGCTANCDLFTCAAGEVPFSVDSTNVPVAIAATATYTSTLSVPTTGTITSIGVQLNIAHTYDGDLDITLAGPAAPAVELTSDNGGTGENYAGTVFSPVATTSVTAGTAPFAGLYLPEGNMTSFYNTAANGTWTLSVTDDAGGDTGSLNGWRLFGCIQP